MLKEGVGEPYANLADIFKSDPLNVNTFPSLTYLLNVPKNLETYCVMLLKWAKVSLLSGKKKYRAYYKLHYAYETVAHCLHSVIYFQSHADMSYKVTKVLLA